MTIQTQYFTFILIFTSITTYRGLMITSVTLQTLSYSGKSCPRLTRLVIQTFNKIVLGKILLGKTTLDKIILGTFKLGIVVLDKITLMEMKMGLSLKK